MKQMLKSVVFAVSLLLLSSSVVTAQDDVVSRFKAALKQQKDLKNYAVGANYAGGHLTITGQVSSDKERSIIIGAAQKLEGVDSIKDEMTVRDEYGKSVYSDEEIKTNIVNALNESSLKAKELSVSEGKVLLSGDYASFKTVDAISAIILSTDGVQGYDTKVTIGGKDYMDQFGGERSESRVVAKTRRACSGKTTEDGKEKKSCGCQKSEKKDGEASCSGAKKEGGCGCDKSEKKGSDKKDGEPSCSGKKKEGKKKSCCSGKK